MIPTTFPDMLRIADIVQGFLFFSQFFNVFNPFSPAVRFTEVFKQKKVRSYGETLALSAFVG